MILREILWQSRPFLKENFKSRHVSFVFSFIMQLLFWLRGLFACLFRWEICTKISTTLELKKKSEHKREREREGERAKMIM